MLRAEAYERFKSRLFSGELKPGQFVTQRELADLIGVPIGPAREAIQRLELESLVKVYPQRGIQIADVSARLIREAYQLRIVLETGAARHFAAKGDRETIRSLIEQTADLRRRAEHKITADLLAQAVEIDWAMHDAIVDSLQNTLFSEAYRVNAARIRLIRANNALTEDRLAQVLDEHLEILSACQAGKASQAIKVLEAHLETSKERALNGL